MNELIGKLQEIVREIEKEHGKQFLLSGVIEPESNFGKIDLILSSELQGKEKIAFLRQISSKIVQKLTPAELLSFGGVVLLAPEVASNRYKRETMGLPRGERISPHRFEDVDIRYAQIFDTDGGHRPYAN
jgi:hypothetical protein